jgi:glycosyltransferase involved in cell wall biosynthesis
VAAADVGILASTVSEGCPLSPQEYMSQGHPVIVTDNGGQREYVIDGQNGLLVPPGDAQALASALNRLTTDAALRQRLGQQAKADFDDHLNYDHYYEQIKKIYEE